jgi:hypothetical protein
MESKAIAACSKVRRYMNFEKFMDLIQNDRLYFCRVDQFEDAFEGYYTKLAYDIAKGITIEADGKSSNTGLHDHTNLVRCSSYVSCWSLGDRESIALWKIYGGTNSVAVETTIDSLEAQTSNRGYSGIFDRVTTVTSTDDKACLLPLLRYEIHPVEYIDHRSFDGELASKLFADPLAPVWHKNIAFVFEQELRLMFQSTFLHISDIPRKLGVGFHVPVDSKGLVQKVIVSPYAEEWFFGLVAGVMERYGFHHSTEWSVLRLTPFQEALSDARE